MNEENPTLEKPESERKVTYILGFYLVTGISTLIVVIEGLLEELGLIVTPAAESLPGVISLLVEIATLVVGFSFIIGIPVAIYIFLSFRNRREILVPAGLLTGAIVFLSNYEFSGSQIDILFWVGGTLLFLYGCSSTAAAVLRR